MPRPRRKLNTELNIAPLVDVLLILLVILLIALPAVHKRAPVDLPETALLGSPSPVVAVRIYIKNNGQLYLENEKADEQRILSKVTPAASVELGADKDVRYDELMRLLALIQAKQPKEFSLVTR